MTPALARLRFPVEATRGRRYPESRHSYRNEFQRDRDRIVHARAFRRLEDKTQVFIDPISDHFRNRLTHTIEVAQIARTVARTLGLDEDLTEALALAHDFGHPPFGHAGEEELDRQMRRFGDRFEHNLHALRIVDSFEQRYALFPGLNLTFEVREGIVKHSHDLTPGAAPDLDEFLPHLRPPLEAQLIDLADETAYNTADLDDGFSAGLFSMADVAHAVPAYAGILETVERQYPAAPPRVQFLESLRLLIDAQVEALIDGTRDAALASGAANPQDVRVLDHRVAAFTPEARETSQALKSFLHQRLYDSPTLREERRRSSRLVARLFELYLAQPSALPEPYASAAAAGPLHRVVCDYIAGMTDRFLLRTAAELHLIE